MEAFDIQIINAVIKFNMDGEVIEAPRVMLNIATLEELTGDMSWSLATHTRVWSLESLTVIS